MYHQKFAFKIAGTGCLLWFLLILSAIPAWLTHVYQCISTEQWLFLIAGAICAPIGVFHGWGLWIGLF